MRTILFPTKVLLLTGICRHGVMLDCQVRFTYVLFVFLLLLLLLLLYRVKFVHLTMP